MKTRFSLVEAVLAIKNAFPVPTTGSWPSYAARIDTIDTTRFDAFVVVQNVWPFIVSATTDPVSQKTTFSVRVHYIYIIFPACMFAIPLLTSLWLLLDAQFPRALLNETLWECLDCSLIVSALFVGLLWSHARKIRSTIKEVLENHGEANK